MMSVVAVVVCGCHLSVFHPETSRQLFARPVWGPTLLNYHEDDYLSVRSCCLSSTTSWSSSRRAALRSQFWHGELYLARHRASIHVSPSPSVPSLVRTHFIARYRFPLQCHAPRHTAAATVQYDAHCFYLSLSLARSLYFLPPSHHT